MILNDKIYSIIKWLVLVVMPALSVLVSVLGKTYGWSGTDLTVTTLNAVTVFLGAITGVSSVKYVKSQKEAKSEEENI